MPTTFAQMLTLDLKPLDCRGCKEMPTGLKSVGISMWKVVGIFRNTHRFRGANSHHTEGRSAEWQGDAEGRLGRETRVVRHQLPVSRFRPFPSPARARSSLRTKARSSSVSSTSRRPCPRPGRLQSSCVISFPIPPFEFQPYTAGIPKNEFPPYTATIR